jgi:hypothetical protein
MATAASAMLSNKASLLREVDWTKFEMFDGVKIQENEKTEIKPKK